MEQGTPTSQESSQSLLAEFIADPRAFFVNHWSDEMKVITGAPAAFLLASLFIGVISVWGVRWYYQKTVGDLNERIKLRDDEIANLKRKIEDNSQSKEIKGESGRAVQVESLTPHELLENYIHDRNVYVADLARSSPVIEGKIFHNVTFVGPAVITFLNDNDINGFHLEVWDNTLDNFFLEAPLGTQLVGLIAFRKSTFRNCSFVRVQVAGPRDLIDKIKAGMTQRRAS